MSQRRDRFQSVRAILFYLGLRWLRTGAIGVMLLGLLGLGEATVMTGRSQAQSIVEDGTTGTQVTEGPVFDGFPNGGFFITGGSVAESNLFHSFETFSPKTRYAVFDLRDSSYRNVSDVFARVSGSVQSSLNGYLGILGGNSPNLFLLNPNGIVLGPQAILDIPGSVFLSSAQSMRFEDDSVFSASDVSDRPLLTVSAPIGVQFGENAAPITVNGRFLSGTIFGDIDRSERYTFRPDTTVTLLGSGLHITNAYFRTDPGNVRLGSVGEGAYVGIDADSYELTYAADTPLKNLTVFESVIDVDGVSDGDVQITGSQVWLDQTVILSGTESAENGGLVSINGEQVTLSDSTIRSIIYDEKENSRATAETQGGSIEIVSTGSFVSEGASQLLTFTQNAGNGGDITINAKDISFLGLQSTGDSPRFSNLLSADTYREGEGGDITLIADTLLANGSTLISSSTNSNFFPQVQTGNGGNIRIEVGQLTLQDLAQIGTGTFGNGDSGNVTVTATRGVDVSGSYSFPSGTVSTGIFTSAERGSIGQGGSLLIETPQLLVSEGGKLSAGTSGGGDAGRLTVRADEIWVSDPVIDRDGGVSGIVATVSPLGSGNGGSLNIFSERLYLTNGGQIAASTDGAGSAGSVDIQSGVIDISGTSADGLYNSSISSRSSTGSEAGSVSLRGDRINITSQGTVSVSNLAGGSAGNVEIAVNSVYLNNGNVQADANAGDQGNINITSQDVLLLREGSRITTNATGTATGGNIFLGASSILGFEDSDISANAVEGDGGSINLVTDGLVGLALRDRLTPGSDITATSETGVNGTINLESPNVDTDSGLVQLPENVVDASNQIAASCAVQDGNQFASTGRGGLPNNPLQSIASNRPWQDMRVVVSAENDRTARLPAEREVAQILAGEIVQEAGEWQVNSAGQVELLAANAVGGSVSDCLNHASASVL